jgi:hypothetical protein
MSPLPLGILAASGGVAGAYELISTQVLSSNTSSITFGSISQDYKHLQIRGVARTTDGNHNGEMKMRFNGVSSSSYAEHVLSGTGQSPNTYGQGGLTAINRIYVTGSLQPSTNVAGFVIDILDYTSVNKNTTTRCFVGWFGSNNEVRLTSGLFNNTAAINSITINPVNDANAIASLSRFSLYGIKG